MTSHRSHALTQGGVDARAVALAFKGSRLLDQWRIAEAEAVLLEALAVNKTIQEESKRLALAEDIQEDLGRLYLRTGRWEVAVRFLQDSLDTNRRLAELDGVSRNPSVDLVRRHKDLGTAYLEWARRSPDDVKVDQLQTAQRQFRTAVVDVARLWEDARGVAIDAVLVRAELHQEVGRFYGYSGFLPAALRQYSHAIEYYRSILVQDKVAECLAEMADLQRGLGKLAEAERLLHEAQGIEGSPNMELHFAELRKEQAGVAESPVKREALLRDGLRHAVQGLMDLDRFRLGLRTEQNRLTWRHEIAFSASQLAFSLAERVGDPRAMADLITISRLSGILEPARVDTTDGYSERGYLHADRSDEDPANSDGRPDTSGGTLIAGSSTLIELGLDSLFRRRPVPPLCMPDGRIALGAFSNGRPTPGEVIRYA